MAYMSANLLSAMRTGAVSGVGAKYLSVKNPKVVSIIGPGVMSQYTLDSFICAQPSLETVKIKGRSQAGIDHFIEYCKANFPSIKEYVQCDTYEDACKDSDIIFYGTTNAAKFEDNPFVKEEWIKPGALIISASALLIDTDFLSKPNCRIVADNYLMYEGWGEGNPLPTQKTVSTLLGMGFYDAVTEGKIKRSDIKELGAIISGDEVGRASEDEIVVYAVGGMSLEDVSWGYECYQNAIAYNIGVKLNLWDVPELAK